MRRSPEEEGGRGWERRDSGISGHLPQLPVLRSLESNSEPRGQSQSLITGPSNQMLRAGEGSENPVEQIKGIDDWKGRHNSQPQ